MTYKIDAHPFVFRIMSAVAVLFGLLTIKSGGLVLFTSGEAHQAAGNYVPFVLWFNFIAGFFYVIAGIGLWLQLNWSALLAKLIAFLTLSVFIAFGVHIFLGGISEVRTIAAMAMRLVIWSSIAAITFIIIKKHTLSN